VESRYLDSKKKFEGKTTSDNYLALSKRVIATFPHSYKSGPHICNKKQEAHVSADKTKKTKAIPNE